MLPTFASAPAHGQVLSTARSPLCLRRIRRTHPSPRMSLMPEGDSAGVEQLSPEEAAREKVRAEEERLRAAEKFIQLDEGNHECVNCSYLYEPAKGEKLAGVAVGTRFEDLSSSFVCPVCRSPKTAFIPRRKTIAGFADNQKYGFGTNSMTAGQKNALIFGGLLFLFVLLLSGYALD